MAVREEVAFMQGVKVILTKRDISKKKKTDEERELAIRQIIGSAVVSEEVVDIFDAVGLEAVFYGEAVVGKNLPQLTYMAVYNDEAHRGEVWKKFLEHPKWMEMKGLEQYQDTVSKIIAQHMVALPYSVIQ